MMAEKASDLASSKGKKKHSVFIIEIHPVQV